MKKISIIFLLILLVCVQCWASSFDGMTRDSWVNLDPVLPLPGTSQLGVGYDRTNDFLVTFGGHPYGGGYPQIDWTGIYDIKDGKKGTWKIPEKYSPPGSTAPPAACEASGTYDPTNELYLLWHTAGYLSTRNEWDRRYSMVEIPRSPFAYEHKTHTWFLTGFLDYVQMGFGGRMAFNSDTQTLFQANSAQDIQKRFGIIDLMQNSFRPVNTSGWSALGPGRGIATPRSDLCLVYDSKRKRYWCVGGHSLTVDEGVNFEYQNVWSADPSDYVWHEEKTVKPEEYFVETWDLGEGISQWTGYKGIDNRNINSDAKCQGDNGLYIYGSGSDAYLYKDYYPWNHVRTFLRCFTVKKDLMRDGERTAIARHYNQSNGEISTLWLLKSGGRLFLDVQFAGSNPAPEYGIEIGRTYRIVFETYTDGSGLAKLFVNKKDYDTPDINRIGSVASKGKVDRFYVGVFDGDSGKLEVSIDSIFHWNPVESLCFMPWSVTSHDACYDPIHDKILMFVLYNNLVEQDVTVPENVTTMMKVFIFDPANKTWTIGKDRPDSSIGHRRTGDLNVMFSDVYNVALVAEAGRCTTNCGQLWAYRYDPDMTGYTPISLKSREGVPAYPRFGYVEIIGATNANVHWQPRESIIDGYNVYRAELKFETYPINAPTGLSNELAYYDRKVVKSITRPKWSDFKKINGSVVKNDSYTDTGLDIAGLNRMYAYVVKAVKNGVESGPSPYWCTIPEFSTGVTVNSDSVNWYLSWTPPHGGGLGIKGYRVFFSPTTDTMAEYTHGIISETKLTIPKIDMPGSHKLFVVAVDNLAQEGFPSNGAWTYHPQFSSNYAKYFEECTQAPAAPKNLHIGK